MSNQREALNHDSTPRGAPILWPLDNSFVDFNNGEILFFSLAARLICLTLLSFLFFFH
jgi:hypothetical protein